MLPNPFRSALSRTRRSGVRPRLPWTALGLLVAGLLATAGPVEASTPIPGRSIYDSENPRPTEVTRSVECELLELRAEERVIVVKDEHGREHEIPIPEEARIRAQSRRDFDGQKNLELGQLEAGHRLKLTFLAESGEIVRVTVLRS